MNRDRRFGFQLRLPNLLFLVITGILVALGTALLDIARPDIWAAIGVVAVLVGVLTYRSRTLLGWLGRRLTYRRSPRNTTLNFESEGVGITWDGRRATACIEVLPQPYAVTVIGNDRETIIRSLPMDDLREELIQFDIHCESVTVITVGHNYDRPNELSRVYHASIGPTPALLYGRTIIEIAINLPRSLDSVYARQGSDGVPAGLSRSITIAAERIRRRIAHDGWKTRMLTKTALLQLHNDLADQLVPTLNQEHWNGCGTNTMRALAYTPIPGAWSTTSYRSWCRLNTHRQTHITRLHRDRYGRDHAEMYVGLLTADNAILSTTPALGLRHENSQHGDIFTAALPSARTIRPTAIRDKSLNQDQQFPIALAPCGIGTFIGHTQTRAQIFVNFSVGDEPFYIFGPAVMCQQLLVWLATSGLRIDIDLPGEQWRQFAERIGATYRADPDADIVVTNDESLTSPAHTNQARLVWTTTPPEQQPAYALIAGGDECTLHTPAGQLRYRWSVSTAEEAFFTVESPTRQPAATRTTPPPLFPEAHGATGRHATPALPST